jgi:hypothetical protein
LDWRIDVEFGCLLARASSFETPGIFFSTQKAPPLPIGVGKKAKKAKKAKKELG